LLTVQILLDPGTTSIRLLVKTPISMISGHPNLGISQPRYNQTLLNHASMFEFKDPGVTCNA
jgi:hypothetical protein